MNYYQVITEKLRAGYMSVFICGIPSVYVKNFSRFYNTFPAG